jgi:hypothetical protein
MDFYNQHITCLNTLHAYKGSARGSRGPEFKTFYDSQLTYLRLIGGFGELLTRYRNIALAGQSTSTASIKFLGHLPASVQKLLDAIPGKFDVLNEIIKGEEVFSNMGRVAKGSSLRRFITAKDDNDQKPFAWGVLTERAAALKSARLSASCGGFAKVGVGRPRAAYHTGLSGCLCQWP